MDEYDSDLFFMQAALSEAELAGQEQEVPIGAVIVHRGHIIGRGRNACERLQDPTAHAEMIAITAASDHLGSWRLEDCTLYVTIEPCPMCMGACYNARMKRIVYGAAEPKAGACGSVCSLHEMTAYNHRLQTQGGVLADQASALIKDFFRAVRQRKKEQGT